MDLSENNAWTRVINQGVRSVSLVDLLAVAVCRDPEDIGYAEQSAKQLMRIRPGARLADLSPLDLKDSTGLESVESTRLFATIELGRRISGLLRNVTEEILAPEAAYHHFSWLADEPSEKFCIAFLNTKGKLMCSKTLHVGTLNMSVVGPREVFREAVRENAATIILAHNHPSGDPEPSPDDIKITQKLSRVGRELDVVVADHLIIGHAGQFVSFSQRGLMG